MSGGPAVRRVQDAVLAAAALLALAGLAGTPSPARALTIDARFDATITSDPRAADIEATLNSVIAQYQARIVDAVTSQIRFIEQTTGLGNSRDYGPFVPYASYLSALQTHASSSDDAIVLTHMGPGPNNPVNGNANLYVPQTLSRTLGFSTAPPAAATPYAVGRRVTVLEPESEGLRTRERSSLTVISPEAVQAATEDTIYLNVASTNILSTDHDASKYSLFAVASHEVDEVLGFGSALTGTANGGAVPTGAIQPEDLFRFDPRGNRSFSTTLSDTAYCCFDGFTVLARFNQKSGGDFSDWYSPGGQTPQVQDAFGTPGSTPQMGVEWRVLDAIGYSYGPAAVWVDFSYGGPIQNGQFATPYFSLAQAIAAVPSGGIILVKGGGYTLELPTITKAMTITTVGGSVNVGF